MDEKILKILIIFLIYYIIIFAIMDFKIKNFISEKFNIVLTVATNLAFIVIIWLVNGLIDEPYSLFFILLIPTAIIAVYIIFVENKTYCFKDMDKGFVKENKADILNIIYEYKNSNSDNELEVSLENNKIIFNKAGKSQIKECLSLVGSYLSKNRKKYTIKDYISHYTKAIVVPVVIAAAVVSIFNIIRNYDSFVADVEQINIKNEFAEGNTEGNINNYGLVAETAESIYYINELQLWKSDKNLKNETVLIEQPENIGKDTLNVVEDWIFYRQGKEIKRARTDGTNAETIFKGYSSHMRVVGNWVYFISLDDDSKLCKIDVNGQNKTFLRNEDVDDMAIYDGRIYYSYEDSEGVYLDVINTDRTGLQRLANIKTRNMIVDGEYIYYIDDTKEILCRMRLKDKLIEKLSNEKIPKFIKDGGRIFYTLEDANNSAWRYKGLYRMNADGSNVLALDSENYLDEDGIGVTEDFVFYVSTNGKSAPGLKIINKDGTRVR